MEISAQQAGELKSLLKACTANVQAGGKSRGAAFFVSNTLLLTSHHVVKDCTDIRVISPTGHSAPATILDPNPGADDDLALLRVTIKDTDPDQPAVLLDNSLDSEQYFVVGYPAEQGFGPGQEGFSVVGHDRTIVNGTPVLLQIDAGKTITYGMSGGPVLNLESGAVVGVVRTSKDPKNALGGGAVPMNVAFDHYPELKEFAENAPVAVQRWRNVLGPELWHAHRQVWELATEIDLTVSGSRNAWEIKARLISEEGLTMSASDLGADLTEAMFRWAQRRRLSSQEEVNLLGRLLAKGLFPPAIEHHLRSLSEADALTIRLHVDPGCGLEDIPWELTCVPGSTDFVAAHPHYRLLRVDDRATSDPGPQTLPEQIKVLAVTGLPSIAPMADFDADEAGWPRAKDFREALKANFEGSAYVYTGLGDELKDLQQALDTGQYDILHYMGIGRISPDRGRAQLRMADFGTPIPVDVQDLLRWARHAGVRVVILQLAEPPMIKAPEPLSVSSLSEALTGSIQAVVLTRFPVHPRQILSFNLWFYSELRSKSLEEAVQEGRRHLQTAPLVEDRAGFGAFTLITDGSPEIRLLARQVPTPDRQPRHSIDQAQREGVAPSRRAEPASADFTKRPR